MGPCGNYCPNALSWLLTSHRRLNSLYKEACAHGNITLQLFMWLPLYSLEDLIREISLDIVDRRSRNANACCRPSVHALGHCVAITHLRWSFGMPCTAVMSPKEQVRHHCWDLSRQHQYCWALCSRWQDQFLQLKIKQKHIWASLQAIVQLAEANIAPRKAIHLSVLCLQNINSNIVTCINNCIQSQTQLSLHL